jgi:hypothetical protein
VLESTWTVARPFIADHVAAATLALVDDVVAGGCPLPCERSAETDDGGAGSPSPQPPDGSVLDARSRHGISVTTATATWHAVTLRAESAGAVRWIRVPGERIDEFLTALDEGSLDGWLSALFTRRRGGRPLRSAA